MARDPSPDLTLNPLRGQPRTLGQLLVTFHLLCVVLDPFTHESAWILPTAARILQVFAQADSRVAWLVTGTADEARSFLGPWADEMHTFADPDRVAVKEMGLERLPALVHLGMQGKIEGVAEGWHPEEWRAVVEHLAKVLSWKAPVVPGGRDPGPFEGSPALA